MIERRAARLLSISGFRLALRSVGLSLAGAVLVFAIIYHASQATIRAALDQTVAGEIADIRSDVHDDHKPLTASVNDAVAEADGTFYALTGPNGALLAGNLTISPALARRWHGLATLHRHKDPALPRHVAAIRGRAVPLPGGQTLYVAENASALLALNRLIANSFLAVFGIILTLGLVGGYLAARASLRRVEAITATAGEIMRGDLSRRVPLSGRGDEFDRLALAQNEMLERIQALMENLRQVSSDIAHDLRAPLARLREHLELARRRHPGPELAAMFDEAIAQLDAALGIFAAVLRIAEIEAGARRASFAPVDLSALLEGLAETYEPVLAHNSQALSLDIAPGLQVRGDRELLTQMFVNVLDNAVQHAPGAAVALHARARAGGGADLILADRGPGIPAAQRARALQRFVRLDSARHSPGSGLGLALVAAVAGLHGGRVRLEDNAPGLAVHIWLPGL